MASDSLLLPALALKGGRAEPGPGLECKFDASITFMSSSKVFFWTHLSAKVKRQGPKNRPKMINQVQPVGLFGQIPHRHTAVALAHK
ncbi:hypothetical protein CUMW_055870 [Citrus unshiu]|nr:hypothetical protein CUMW_055870 [Citrus unshiu]